MKNRLLAYLTLCLSLASIPADAQQENPKATNVPPLPFTSQIRKTVAFIALVCRDGNRELTAEGTGFFVSYPDKRLGENGQFVYLVTNRHVALCEDSGHDYPVEKVSLRLNLKTAKNGDSSQTVVLNEHGNVQWPLPTDDSVDLAALPLLPPVDQFDYLWIPAEMFATKDVIEKEQVVEGDRVLFTGLFYRLPGDHRMQPIIREGTLAMMPEEKIKTTLGKPGMIYLADVHVLKGNSGSPVIINLGGMRPNAVLSIPKPLLLGVVSGYFLEDENLNLEVTTTIHGIGEANSGISIIVPVDELKKLLEEPDAQMLRDLQVRSKTGK